MIGFGRWSRQPNAESVLRVAVLALGLASCDAVSQTGDGSDRPAHHTADGFKNLHIADPDKTFFNFLFMKYFGDTEWADHEARAAEVPTRPVDPQSLSPAAGDMTITWLGHSTFLIQWAGKNILTDPIFANRASPVTFAGPKRYIPHVIDYAELPSIDYVVISHDHYDHLDRTAVSLLGDGPFYLVPLRLKAWFVENGVSTTRVSELDWWDQADFPDIRFQAMPAQHWSGRGPFGRRKTLWASWLIELDGTKLWFAGDTGYNPVQFKEIGRATGGVDVALIPIGGYVPRWFMGPYHVNPEEAIKIHRDIGATTSIGMHWGTFPLTAEGPIDPQRELEKQKALYGMAPGAFITMTVGETLRRSAVSQVSGVTWRREAYRAERAASE